MSTPASISSQANRSSLFASSTLEFRLVALCCRWPPDAVRSAALEPLLRKPVEWALLLRLAERHRVCGFVSHALGSRPEVPSSVREELKAQAYQIVRNNLINLAALMQINDAFLTGSIPFLVLKGLPLSQLAFGSLSLRHSKDVDLLIREQDFSRVDAVLSSLGFIRNGLGARLTKAHSGIWKRYKKHHEYVHPRHGARLEVHWRAFNNGLLGPLSTENPEFLLLKDVDRTIPVLPREEMLLNLCVHGASHAWFRLKWVVDVAALLSRESADSLASLRKNALTRDLDRPVEQALQLCAELFPDLHFARPASYSAVNRWLLCNAANALQEAATSPSSEADYVPPGFALSQMLLRRNWRYRLEEVLVRMASPMDWLTVSLPASLHLAYPLLRVPLWLRRRWLPRQRNTAKTFQRPRENNS